MTEAKLYRNWNRKDYKYWNIISAYRELQ